jgi:hypothetical protein
MESFEEMTFLDMKRFFGVGDVAGEFNQFFNYMRNTGDYTNGYSMEAGVSPLMNYPKLLKHYEGSLVTGVVHDYTCMLRMVVYYTNLEYSSVVSIFNNEFLNEAAGVVDSVNLAKSCEFRRQMMTGLSMYMLFLVPTLRASYTIVIGGVSKVMIRKPTTYASTLSGIISVGELFTMSNVMITAHAELALLSESMTDPSFHLDRSFTDTTIAHYYTTSMIQLLIGTAIRSRFCDKGRSVNTQVLALVALGVIRTLDFASDPNNVRDEILAMVGVIPLAGLVFAFVDLVVFSKNLFRRVSGM